MSIYLVSRHQGAVDWMNHTGHHYDAHLTHLTDYEMLTAGDTVIGSLPINIVADLNVLGVNYLHLSLYIPEQLRGVELTAEQLSALDAKLEQYVVRRVNSDCP
ncbi:CRISPR-associated protein Csx16 [Psychrobacter jeotgali]|uniref:CRISPR-associated protein Csx16 n=1 Tax=Psychrobacter jeotgali TaxID=179010 RepID=UPI00191B26A3|nr:CRISPR-associated protein Csx16 [Psychrobacter jeotgali]